MGKRIEYEKGQELGPYGIKYIKETEPYIQPSNNRHIRQAEFECHCGKHFITRIAYIKNGHTKSCGCKNEEAKRERIIKYNSEGHDPWNKEKLIPGQEVGNYGLIFVKETEPHINKEGKRKWRKGIFICPFCGKEFEAIIGNVKKGYTKSCGQHNSLGEEKINKILTENNINFEYQKTFSDLYGKNKHPYFFDFYLPDYNILIEYDGIQHFQYTEGSCWNDKQNYIDTKERDKKKDEYCLKNNIPLIRIPYTDFDILNYNYLIDKIKGVTK